MHPLILNQNMPILDFLQHIKNAEDDVDFKVDIYLQSFKKELFEDVKDLLDDKEWEQVRNIPSKQKILIKKYLSTIRDCVADNDVSPHSD